MVVLYIYNVPTLQFTPYAHFVPSHISYSYNTTLGVPIYPFLETTPGDLVTHGHLNQFGKSSIWKTKIVQHICNVKIAS
jgi:hypothetical protein